jgi:protein-tyrosine phosphatase
MNLDYTSGCVNFRDVGESVNILAARNYLPVGKLFRGGKLDFVSSPEEIHAPKVIINLRKSKDSQTFGAQIFDFPISNDLEKYETFRPQVRQWLCRVIRVFEDEELLPPFLIHCTSGKDRTGVAIAALLKLLEVPDTIIVEEYLLSKGEVKKEWIEQAITGLGNPNSYFQKINLKKIKKLFQP